MPNPGPAPETDPEAILSRKFFYYMALMRDVEERIQEKLYRQGKVVGGVYIGRGQEAISVGVGMTTRPDDFLFPCHRDMALYFIRGIQPREVFAQYMGRVGGLTGGRDGNMHMGDINRRISAIISALAAWMPVAAGAGMAMKYLGTSDIVYAFFGDGSTSRGDWHEGVNLAAVQRAPVVFVCNNNQWAYSTPLEKQMACTNVADRGPGYGIPSEIVDGNDVWAVYRAGQRAAEYARSGKGPYLIECKTFRMTGHSAHDPAHYVPAHLWTEWAAKDPIERLERLMIERGWSTREEIDAHRRQVRDEVEEAVSWAEASPYPDPATLLENVYESRPGERA
jgi:pyruvate dehydrogenase E1 component alpha subunit